MTTATTPSRGLPGHITDLIGFGIEPTDDRRPLFSAVTRTAMSAVRRGWTKTEWRGALEDGIMGKKGGKKERHNTLWQQITHRRRRHLSWATIHTFLDKIWEQAIANISRGNQTDPLELADDWEQALPRLPLSRAEQRVLRYVIGEVRRRKFHKVTCPGRDVAKKCEVSHQTAVDSLKSLHSKGYILCTYRGLGNPRLRMAAIYRLGDIRSLLGSPTVDREDSLEQSKSPSTSTHQYSSGKSVYYQRVTTRPLGRFGGGAMGGLRYGGTVEPPLRGSC